MNEIPEVKNDWDSPPSGLPPPQPTGGTTETGPTASYDPFAKKDEVPIGKSSKPLIPKVSIYDRQSILNLLVVFGIMSIIVGASICSLSGIVFRPEAPSGADYDDIEEYNDDVDTRNQVSSFIYMMGSTILMIGLLLVIFKVGLIVVSSTFPTGLRIAAGILLVVLIPFFLTIFIMAGPARLLTNIDGGYYYGW